MSQVCALCGCWAAPSQSAQLHTLPVTPTYPYIYWGGGSPYHSHPLWALLFLNILWWREAPEAWDTGLEVPGGNGALFLDEGPGSRLKIWAHVGWDFRSPWGAQPERQKQAKQGSMGCMLGSSQKIEKHILKVHHSLQAAQVGIRSWRKAIALRRGPPRKMERSDR